MGTGVPGLTLTIQSPVTRIRPAAFPELEKIAAAMPEQCAAMILLASWWALRFGELTELRRADVGLEEDEGTIRV